MSGFTGAGTAQRAGRPLQASTRRSILSKSGIQAGHEHNDDLDGASQLGVGRLQFIMRDGSRCTAADAYLHPARQRPNLHVLTGVLVTRVLLEGSRAVGVTVSQYGNEEETLRAEREVIVSPGA
jgi:choline dehydrogenase